MAHTPWPRVPVGRERHALRVLLYAACLLAALAWSASVYLQGGPPPWPAAAAGAAAAALLALELRAGEMLAQCAAFAAGAAALAGSLGVAWAAPAILLVAALVVHPAGSVLLAGLAQARGSVSIPLVLLAPLVGAVLEIMAARLRRMAAQVELLKAAQARMVDTIGHEIRTPLTEIKVLTDLLVRVLPLGPPVEHLQRMTPMLYDMRRHCDELAGMVERAQWYQRLAEHQVTLSRADSDVAALLREVSAGFEERARARHIRLQVDTPARVVAPVNVRALRRSLENVIDNALKYAPEGGCTRAGCRRRGARVELWVEDDGPGIRAEDLPYVCEPFFHREYVIDAADSQRGIGLGLPITRQIVEAHGGDLRIDSDPGRGTRVRISLPLHVTLPAQDAAGN